MKPKVSVIVPVYNVEKYLSQCLDSLVNQTLKEIEIISVNDGSTDGSLKILEEYKSKDSRIIIINQKNRGLSEARNAGMKKATGEYVGFVDSDDWVDEQMFEKLFVLAKATKSEITITKVVTYDEKTDKSFEEEIFDLSKFFNNEKEMKGFNYRKVKVNILNGYFAPWTCLFLRGFLTKQKLNFEPGLYFEDIPFHLSGYLTARKMSYLNEPLYHYRINRKDSIMSKSLSDKKVFDIFEVMEICKEILKKTGKKEELRSEFLLFQVQQFGYYIENCTGENRNEFYKQAVKEMKDASKGLSENETKIALNLISSKNINEYLLLKKIEKLELEVSELKQKSEKNQAEIKEKEEIIKSLLNSKSWKVTKPLRSLSNSVRKRK